MLSRRLGAFAALAAVLLLVSCTTPPAGPAAGVSVSPDPVNLWYGPTALLVTGQGLIPGAQVSIQQVAQRPDGGYTGQELTFSWVTVKPDGSLPPTPVAVRYAFSSQPTIKCKVDCKLSVRYAVSPQGNQGIREIPMSFIGLTADLDYDGDAECDDLDVLLDNWGATGVDVDGDLNGDGSVTIVDLSIWLSNYSGPECE